MTFKQTAEKNYVTGFIAHTARHDKYMHWRSKWTAASWKGARNDYRNHDVYELMAEYLQTKLQLFKESGKDEKALKFKMMKDVREAQAKQFNALKALWKGSGEGLVKNYWLYVIWMDRDSGAYSWFGAKTSPRNLKIAFMHRCNDIYNQVIKKSKNYALLMQIAETQAIWCSEGDLTEKTCQ